MRVTPEKMRESKLRGGVATLLVVVVLGVSSFAIPSARAAVATSECLIDTHYANFCYFACLPGQDLEITGESEEAWSPSRTMPTTYATCGGASGSCQVESLGTCSTATGPAPAGGLGFCYVGTVTSAPAHGSCGAYFGILPIAQYPTGPDPVVATCDPPNSYGVMTSTSWPIFLYREGECIDVSPAPNDTFSASDTVLVGGVTAQNTNGSVTVRPSAVTWWEQGSVIRWKNAYTNQLGNDSLSASEGNFVPILNDALGLANANPPSPIDPIFGSRGTVDEQSNIASSPTTPTCYGIESNDGLFHQPLQVCSPFLP